MLNHIPKKKLLLLMGDVLLIYCACVMAPAIRFQIMVFEPLMLWREILTIMTTYLLCLYVADFYNIESGFTGIRYIFKYLATLAIAAGIMLIIFFLFPMLKLGRGVFIVNAISISVLIYLWRLFFKASFEKYIPRKQRVFLIIGAGSAGNKIYRILKNDTSCRVAGFIDDDRGKQSLHKSLIMLDNLNGLEQIVKDEHVDNIVIAIKDLKDKDLLKNIIKCKLNGINIYDVPSFYEYVLGKIEVDHLSDLWILNMPIHGVKKTVYNKKVKRLISIFFSLCFLAITSPVFLIVMICIKIDSKGPVFYKQKRVGFNGSGFEVIKFRTMKVGTENDREFAGRKDDPRITRVGRILRVARIDEIPQMWNVLKGEMGLIGPRALMVEEVEEFEKKVPYFSIRHSVKPGVTGWAQVNYQHGATVEDALEKLKYDLFYIKNLSPFLDFHILLRTVRVVLFGKGAR
jgi:exopolysaccharide biosynthesis polyprenyl glycosylphosphotransferase